jgi:hypothetical protein
LGVDTGYSATSANNSNFIGNQAGYSATSASNSNFIGYQAGYMQQVLITQISLVIKLNSATNVFGSNLFELILGWGEECLLFKFQ